MRICIRWCEPATWWIRFGSAMLAVLFLGGAAIQAATGVTGVTHGSVDLRVPPTKPTSKPEGVSFYYGLGMPIQLDATTGGLLVNIRLEPQPYGDFEVGTDLIKFKSLSDINAANAVPVSRPSYEPNPWTDTPSVTVMYPLIGGFVPRGARLANGSPHPHAGTGFGICEVGYYPFDFSKPLPNKIGYKLDLQQFSYDGSQFTASKPIRMSSLSVGNTSLKITAGGISPALCDGSDLLFAVMCSDTNGVARFQYGAEGWRPTSFVPVATSGVEPSLIRDVDGSLLYTNRSDTGGTGNAILLWRSTDGGITWKNVFKGSGRSTCPVVLNQAVDGTPFLTTTLSSDNDRSFLQIIPLNSNRTGLDTPIMVRNGPTEFGPSPSDRVWYIDHPVGNVLRLADGKWHSIQTYRVADLGELQNLPISSPHTGFYVEEVFSSGTPRVTKGVIIESEPSK